MESGTYTFCLVLIKMGLKEQEINEQMRSYKEQKVLK